VVLTALLAAVWAVVAPTPQVREIAGVVVSDGTPEFSAAQDAVFALLALAAGVLHGVVVLAVGRARPSVAFLAMGAGLVGSLAAWRLGVLLGPPSLAAQRAAGGALVAPLGLHAFGVLCLWPAATATTVSVWLLSAGLRGR
jgi:hypothetical protein